MQKNQIITGIVVILVLVGIGYLASIGQEGKTPEEQGGAQEVFSLAAVVQSVDAENNVLVVKLVKEEKEVKVNIAETTKLIELGFPFDPQNPPADATFTPTQTEIEISDFAAGDNVFIKAKENIAGKSEIENIDFIHILP